ncbi:40S ribosomal protein S21 [Datura stramonium]|nr:40S ribosomal protein S21 [Datura stramonium]
MQIVPLPCRDGEQRRSSPPSTFVGVSSLSVFQVLSTSKAYLCKTIVKMQNDEGQNMDLYIPRKCSATNRLITSKDHASVQLNVGHLDEFGRYTGQFTTYALCGFIRAQGDADSALDRLWQKKKAEVGQQ